MIGKTLFFYIGWRFLRTLLAMLALLLSLALLIEFIENMRRFSDYPGVSGGEIFLMSFFKAPFYIDKAFPFSALFAAMITLGQLNAKMELVVARAAGISAWQFLMPIGAVGMLVGIVATTGYNPVAMWAFDQSENMRGAIVAARDGKKAENTASGIWLRQKDDNGSTVINAAIARNNGRLLNDVIFIRFDDQGSISERLEAGSAVHQGNSWLLSEGHRIVPGQRDEAFKTAKIKTNISQNHLLGASASPDSVPFWNLSEIAEKIRLSGLNHLPYQVQFHALLALPLFMLAMVVIAASVSLKFVRFGEAGKLILGGILSGFMLYAFAKLINSLGSNGIVSPFVAAWSPAFVAILFGTSILLYQEDG